MHTIGFALVLLFTSTALADQVAQSEIDVIDGSTVRVHGQVIHIIGIDTPKLGQKAHCGLERMLAARATSRLRQIVRSGFLCYEHIGHASTFYFLCFSHHWHSV
jgi:endonuclease YncB( thermonuclease family)